LIQEVDISRKNKLLFITTGLGKGGAENALFKIISILKNEFNITVISLSPVNFFNHKLNEIEVETISYNFNTIINSFKNIIKIIIWIKKNKPDLIQTWMYHADFISIFLKFFVKSQIIWGIRNGSPSKKTNGFKTYLIIKINSIFSKITPDKIIYCSINSKLSHEKFGFNEKKGVYIPNGVQIKSHDSSINKEKENNIFTIGNISRWHPHKDHKTLIQAISVLKTKGVKLKLILVGKNLDVNNIELVRIISDYDLENEIELIGETNDVDNIYNKIDLFVLSSINEGFPNVILEAINNKILVISSNVGDAFKIISDEQLFLPGDPSILANKIEKYLNIDSNLREKTIENNFNTIKENYSIEVVTNKYNYLYNSVIKCVE
jgi:glycosyltransferase involved in cell wall biosynthesis